MDFAAAGLLDGLDGPARRARLELLELLHREGVTLEQLAAAVSEDRLALLPLERRLGGRHTAAELERATGVPAALLLRLRRVLGLADAGAEDRVWSDEDIEQARSIRLFLDAGFDEERLIELTRILGESIARIAAATTGVFAETFLRPGDSELEVATRFDALAQRLTPAFGPVLLASFTAHLRDIVHRGILGRTELDSGQLPGAQQTAVCFADLVGFTALAGELDVRELGSVAGRLAGLAGEHAAPPVRLVKTIGDAVMLVCAEPEPLVAAALALLADAEREELPSLRAGIAFGPALQRAGDYYGHPVNLASRITGVARPGSVLCAPEVRAHAEHAFSWSYAGRFRLKGLSEAVPLHRARPQHAPTS